MKYSQVIPAYKMTWEVIESFLDNSQTVLLCEEQPVLVKKAWFRYYFYQTSPEVYYFLMNSNQILLAFAGEFNTQELVISQVLVAKNQASNTKEILKDIQIAAKILLVESLSFKKEQVLEAIVYPLLQADFVYKNKKYTQILNYHRALVLSGGGAKGAYQIGAWQAFAEAGLTFPIITGTSVGALNGALILQDDFQQAKKMWEAIDSKQILAFPSTISNTSYSMEQVMTDMRSFIKTAWLDKGVKTEPLQQLIEARLDAKKMKASQSDLFICTTKAKNMTEVVVALKQEDVQQMKKWLLASSSFFPAMSAAKIDDDFYIDGGYRNNIPVDVAIDKGANSLLVVDIMGPGVTKTNVIPPEYAVNLLKSRWSLGNVLLFDGSRSKWNITLGYLEAQKLLGKLTGDWYSFNYDDQQAIRKINKHLGRKILTNEQLTFLNSEQLNVLLKKLRKLKNDTVSIHTCFFDLFEILAKILNVSPIKVYSEASFIEAIVAGYETLATNEVPDVTMLLSVGELLQNYFGSAPLVSEESQLLLILALFQKGQLTPEQWRMLYAINAPMVLMAQMLATFLEKKE